MVKMQEMKISSRNQVSVSRMALQHNFRCIRERVGEGVEVMAMVKGDGYGHGMLQSAVAFAEAGCRTFGVAELVEAVSLRQSGITGAIFVMLGFEPDEARLFFDYDLTPIVFCEQDIEALSGVAVQRGREIGVHLKVDCGMGRLGLLPAEVPGFVDRIVALPGISLAGIMAHFPEADNRNSVSSHTVFATYERLCHDLGERFQGIRHIANSGATLHFPEMTCDMVRAGIALYGYYPDGTRGPEGEQERRLMSAMTFTTQVIQLKDLPAGSGISYGHTFTTDRPTRIAALPVGYEDGYLRDLSNRGAVLIRGQRAPIRGRVCMNLCLVDVTDIAGVQAGDEVMLLGKQGSESITADEIAGWMQTISYEVLCLFGNNNSRTHTE
ncbi:MAG: alanine racemase [Desulfoprunum sp.]|nr:alanine racemase [Desulfoprunum sp.]